MTLTRAAVLSAAVVLCCARAATADFACSGGANSSIYSCLCSAENAGFTSTLCSYFDQANTTYKTDFGLYAAVHDVDTAYTLFAVNNSAYAALTAAETTFYESVLDDSLNYLAVNDTYNLTTLADKTSFALPTLAGSNQLILVTTANNVTVLNDDDTCVVTTCSPTGPGKFGTGSVCLVDCLLSPQEGLGTIAIIGIVVAGIAAVCLIVACLFNIFRKEDSDSAGDDDGTNYNAVEDGE